MEKHVFLDTNVLQQCKLFTEIDWEVFFEDNPEKITIHIPNMVLKELDNNKKESKKARQVIPLLRKLMEKEFKPKIFLELTLFPTKWDSLKEEWKERLDKTDPDHHIIGDILLYKLQNLSTLEISPNPEDRKEKNITISYLGIAFFLQNLYNKLN